MRKRGGNKKGDKAKQNENTRKKSAVILRNSQKEKVKARDEKEGREGARSDGKAQKRSETRDERMGVEKTTLIKKKVQKRQKKIENFQRGKPFNAQILNWHKRFIMTA